MTYSHRAVVLLALLLSLGAASGGALLAAASAVAEDDLGIGKGHSRFPPQQQLRMMDGREVAR